MKKGRKNKTIYFRKDYYLPQSPSNHHKKSLSSAKSPISKQNTQISQKIQSLGKTIIKRRSTSSRPAAHRSKARQSFSWREVTLMSLVGTSALTIAFTFIFSNIFNPTKLSEQEISKLANEYYIEYLYPRALGKYLDQPKIILKDYANSGFPSVRLNQLLSYNSNAHLDSLNIFSNSYYQCDTNATHVKYYPVEPYGPRDFTISYSMSCAKPDTIE